MTENGVHDRSKRWDRLKRNKHVNEPCGEKKLDKIRDDLKKKKNKKKKMSRVAWISFVGVRTARRFYSTWT